MTLINISIQSKGGPGSGNWGHRGIPGKVGGSSPRGAGGFVAGTAGSATSTSEARATLMLTTGSGTERWKGADDRTRRRVKSTIIDNLVEVSGVNEYYVDSIIRKWEHTSNGRDAKALSIQEAASEEFGVPLSDWQKDNIAEINAHTMKGPVKGFGTRGDERKVLRAMYNSTQEELKNAGYKSGDTVTLYRGVEVERKLGRRIGDVTKYKGNAIESWSVSYDVAKDFSDKAVSEKQGIAISMQIPVENIVGSAVTGFGCLIEGEFIVLGSIPGAEATVLYAT